MKPRCLETRQRRDLKWRRYRSPAGYTFETFEMPTEAIKRFGWARLREEIALAERRHLKLARQARALQLLAEGWKPAAVALETGYSEAHVYRLRYAGKPGAKTHGVRA